MLEQFKEFIVKGNAFDLAVGVIIGGAFGAMAGSFVSDVMMPPIGLVTGGTDFTNLFLTLKAGRDARAVCVAGGGQGRRRRHPQPRRVPQHRRQPGDRRLRAVPDGASDQCRAQAGAGGAAGSTRGRAVAARNSRRAEEVSLSAPSSSPPRRGTSPRRRRSCRSPASSGSSSSGTVMMFFDSTVTSASLPTESDPLSCSSLAA